MDGMYGLRSAADFSDKAFTSPENMILPADCYQNFESFGNRVPLFVSDEMLTVTAASAISEGASIAPEIPREEDVLNLIKAKIAFHPSYPRLLEAYIDCQKVGAPAEISCLLDEIRRENDLCKGDNALTCFGADPELDEFMETYYGVLMKYKSDLERPFDEATDFLNKVEMQLRDLCTGASARSLSDEGGAHSSEEELCGGETELQEVQPSSEDRDLKDRLMRKFGSHISTLKLEFSKKRKKVKLPKEARQTLLQWWNIHYKWPYPTEADKIALAESTGLDPKQINNWFINQRKRHWKPAENMQFPGMDHDLSGQFYPDD